MRSSTPSKPARSGRGLAYDGLMSAGAWTALIIALAVAAWLVLRGRGRARRNRAMTAAERAVRQRLEDQGVDPDGGSDRR